MANQEHLDILKRGVDIWNQWIKEHRGIKPDLSGTNLSQADLKGIDLIGADLSHTNLFKTNLSNSDLRWSDLNYADLSVADLYEADLSGANFSNANLSYATLCYANLSNATLSYVNLGSADLSGADLIYAHIGSTIFADIDLSEVHGLDEIHHMGPSTIGIDTIYLSQGKIPDVFLRGAGVPETLLTYMRSGVGQLDVFYSCFISYSSKDQAFVERLYADLQNKGVRCWFAPEDLKIGDKIRPGIDEAIRIHDKLLLVLSENSVESTWVEKEVETAFEKEAQQKRLVLFPIRLDDTVMETNQAWAADIRRTRHIGDFREWKNSNDYRKALTRLLRDLKTELPRRL